MNKKLKRPGGYTFNCKGLSINMLEGHDLLLSHFRAFISPALSFKQSKFFRQSTCIWGLLCHIFPLLKQQMKPSSYENKSH